MIARKLLPRTALIVSVMFIALAIVDGVGTAPARAESTKADVKPPPDPIDPSKKEVISECTRAAYAGLAKEAAALRAAHAGNEAGFASAYALRKEQLVGAAAMRAKGCAPARLE